MKYRPYFGLLMSKLYSNNDQLTQPSLKLSSHPHSLLGIIMKKKINSLLPPQERYTIYNSGSKLTLYLLQLIQREGLSSSLVHTLTCAQLRLN